MPRIRTTNLPARAHERAVATLPAALGSLSRRFTHWSGPRGRQLAPLADAITRRQPAPRETTPRQFPIWVEEESQRLGLPLPVVADAFDHLAEAEHATIRRHEMRREAWLMHNANRPGCHAFWRGGFRTRWGRRVDLHDYTIIPGYDQIHGQICGFYPEWSGREYEFYCELLGPLPRLTPAKKLWQTAIALAQEHGESPVPNSGEPAADF